MAEQYFGAYCEQCGVWLKDAAGKLLYYPHPAIVLAHWKDPSFEISPYYNSVYQYEHHLWAVTEFGKEERKHPTAPGQALCPQYLTYEYR